MKVCSPIMAMEPLLPSVGERDLAELSQAIVLETGQLMGCVPSPLVRQAVADLIRTMNCYYSNLIKELGHCQLLDLLLNLIGSPIFRCLEIIIHL